MGELIFHAICAVVGAVLCLWLVILLLPTLVDHYWRSGSGSAADKDEEEEDQRRWGRPTRALWWWHRRRMWSRSQPFASFIAAVAGVGFLILAALSVGLALHLVSPGDREGEPTELTRIADANERIAGALESPQPDSPPRTGSVTVVSEDLTRIADALESDVGRVTHAGNTVRIDNDGRWGLGIFGGVLLISVAVWIWHRRRAVRLPHALISLPATLVGALSIFSAIVGEVNFSPFTGFKLFQKVEIHHVITGGGGTGERAVATGVSTCSSVHRFGIFVSREDRNLEGQGPAVSFEDTASARSLRAWLERLEPQNVLVVGSTDPREPRGADLRRGNAELAERRARAVADLIADMTLETSPSVTIVNFGLGVSRLIFREERAATDTTSGREVFLCALRPAGAAP